MYYGASKLIRERAKELRLNLTAEEKMLWAYISNKQLGARFRRQHPIHTYIAESFVLNSNSLLKWMVESIWERNRRNTMGKGMPSSKDSE